MKEKNLEKIDWSPLHYHPPAPVEKIDWSSLQDQLPDPVWRHRWDDLAEKYGLPFKRSYMQNLDSEGKGPEKKYLNKRVAYPLTPLITWLNSL